MVSPVNASRRPSRTTRASLGAGTVRYSFTVTDFHRLPFAGLPAHPPAQLVVHQLKDLIWLGLLLDQLSHLAKCCPSGRPKLGLGRSPRTFWICCECKDSNTGGKVVPGARIRGSFAIPKKRPVPQNRKSDKPEEQSIECILVNTYAFWSEGGKGEVALLRGRHLQSDLDNR